MKRMLLFLGLALVVMNVTTGCNKTDETAATPAMDTNSAATNAAPPAAH